MVIPHTSTTHISAFNSIYDLRVAASCDPMNRSGRAEWCAALIMIVRWGVKIRSAKVGVFAVALCGFANFNTSEDTRRTLSLAGTWRSIT